MKKYTIQIVVSTLLGLFLLVVWGAEVSLSRAYDDLSLTLNPAKAVASTSIETKGEKLTSSQQTETFQLSLTNGYVAPTSLAQAEINQQSYSYPPNPGHAPGHPRPSALTPLFFGVSGGLLVIGITIIATIAFTKRSKVNK